MLDEGPDLPLPIALCLERLGATPEERYTRCTARSGRLRGLAIGLDGTISWCSASTVACELWVSRDQRLMVLRPAQAPEVWIVRGDRRIVLPEDQRAVLRHLDEIAIGDARYRVHVHGTTREVHPPRRILALPTVVTLAAALASGAACGGGVATPPAEDAAPDAARSFEPVLRDDPDASVTVIDASDASDASDVIEIRPFPPL